MKIAVDFDGTVVDHRFPDLGEDVPGAQETLVGLVKSGHQIFLYTMRSGEYLSAAIKWFIDRNIPLSGINTDPEQSSWTQSPKCYAELYIDDSAFGCPLVRLPGFYKPCVDWKKIKSKFLELKTSIEKVSEVV